MSDFVSRQFRLPQKSEFLKDFLPKSRAAADPQILPFAPPRTLHKLSHEPQSHPEVHGKPNPMQILFREPHFTFRFADDRIIPRFHLEGVEAGRPVAVFKIDPATGERLGLLATATVGEGGWVDLPEPIIVRAGEAFIAVPEQEG